ncbi:coiled-coil domain-containing protein 158 isoform X2 [Xenopus laevis]|uniref:Coiled-coil domain-containing protein 158 isoform X2 n=1 Tax=Xenopus laevis TaxID=8355 RepID=A0A8J0UUK7_XENLA|nr:coiled-coil domain-containing protein 158 isoform X2 [Xenopus laevis]
MWEREMANKNLQTLRDQLEAQTREIQKLQDEVEQATQRTINKLSISYHEQSTVNSCGATEASTNMPMVGSSNFVPSLHFPSLMLQHFTPEDLKSPASCSSKPQDVLRDSMSNQIRQQNEEDMDKSHSQCRDTQKMSNKSCIFHEHKALQLRQSISELQCKIKDLEKERESMLDMRQQESKSHEEANRQFQVTIQELQIANQLQEEMLKQSHIYTDLLKEMIKNQDRVFQDIQEALGNYEECTGKKEFGERPAMNLHARNLGTLVSKRLQDLASEINLLKTKNHETEGELDFLKKELQNKESLLKNQQERCDALAKEHEQKVSTLTDEASRLQSHAATLQTQMEIIQEQAKGQISNYMAQNTNLETTVSQLQSELRNDKMMYKEKIEDLRGQLVASDVALKQAQNGHVKRSQELVADVQQLKDALMACEELLNLEKEQNKQLREFNNANCLTNENLRRELIERSMEAKHLQSLLSTLKEDGQQQMVSLHEITTKLKFTSTQLDSTTDLLHKTKEELAIKKQSLDNAETNILSLKMSLEEKECVLRDAMDKIKKLRTHAEVRKREAKQLKTELYKLWETQKQTENTKIQLAEKEQMIIAMQGHAENLTLTFREHRQTVESLQNGNSQLLEVLCGKKAEIQAMKTKSETKDTRIQELETLFRNMELEKLSLINASTEKTLEAKELIKERDQLLAELKVTQKDLSSLAEDYKILKRNYENGHGEGDTISVLKMQLKATLAELEQTKTSLRMVESCDGHAIKVAMRMQKKITSKRGQIDELQSRVHLLNERLSAVAKDKLQLKEEKTKLLKEKETEAKEQQNLFGQVVTLTSENNNLKGNIACMESALEKASLQLSESQAMIQHLEQEAMRLRLQHTLDMKELKGPSVDNITTKTQGVHPLLSCPGLANFPLFQTNLRFTPCSTVANNFFMDKPTRDVDQFSEKKPMINDEEQAVHTKACEKKDAQTPRSHISSMEPLTLHTVDLEEKDHSLSLIHPENSFSGTPCYTSSPKKFAKEQNHRVRSPVHSLLTAPYNSSVISSTLESNPLIRDMLKEDLTLDGKPSDPTNVPSLNLQGRLESLQCMAEELQMKNKEMSSIFRKHDKAIIKATKQEEKLKK